MARKSILERIAQLDAQKKTLQARLGKQERAKDTRRKVLVGALLLHRLEDGGDELSGRLRDWLRRELPGFLTRDGDKALFAELLAVPAQAEEPATERATVEAASALGEKNPASEPASSTPGAPRPVPPMPGPQPLNLAPKPAADETDTMTRASFPVRRDRDVI